MENDDLFHSKKKSWKLRIKEYKSVNTIRSFWLVDVSKHPLLVGEFSLEVTDCQKYLDGGYAEPYLPPSKKFNQFIVKCMKFSQSVL